MFLTGHGAIQFRSAFQRTFFLKKSRPKKLQLLYFSPIYQVILSLGCSQQLSKKRDSSEEQLCSKTSHPPSWNFLITALQSESFSNPTLSSVYPFTGWNLKFCPEAFLFIHCACFPPIIFCMSDVWSLQCLNWHNQ